MGLFLTRTLTDGLLETRRYKLRCLAENSLGAGTPSAIVIVATLFLGSGAGSIFFAVVAASVRSARAATLWGVALAAGLVLLMLFTHWLFTHPIEPG